MVLALSATGCPVGAALDTPYQEYTPPPDSGGTLSTITSSTTTGAPETCTDEQVDETFLLWCGGSICHGNPGVNNAQQPPEAPFWIFSPTRKTDWVGRPGTLTAKHDCTTERIIDGTNPGRSLIVSSLTETAACGLQMPYEYPIPENDVEVITCIASWVNAVVEMQVGATTQSGVGGTSAL